MELMFPDRERKELHNYQCVTTVGNRLWIDKNGIGNAIKKVNVLKSCHLLMVHR